MTARDVDPLRPPDREGVRGVATADDDDVLLHEKRSPLGGLRSAEELQMRCAGAPGEAGIEIDDVHVGVGRGGGEIEDRGAVLPRQAEDVIVEPGSSNRAAETATETDDVPRSSHGGQFWQCCR